MKRGYKLSDFENVPNEVYVKYSEITKDDDNEPFDPAYLTDKPYEAPEISSYEKRFLRKVSIIENKLRRAKVRYEWLEDYEMFRVAKYRNGSEYPSYMYIAIYMDDNTYAFGGWTEDAVVDGRASVVVKAAIEWMSNNKPSMK